MVKSPPNYFDEGGASPVLYEERCKRPEMIMFRLGQLPDFARPQRTTVELLDNMHPLLVAVTDLQQLRNQVVRCRGTIVFAECCHPTRYDNGCKVSVYGRRQFSESTFHEVTDNLTHTRMLTEVPGHSK